MNSFSVNTEEGFFFICLCRINVNIFGLAYFLHLVRKGVTKNESDLMCCEMK